MKTDYDNSYYSDNVYGHVVSLLTRQITGNEVESGIHLDLGCGYGRISEPLCGATGSHYVGIDLDQEGVNSLLSRNMEAHICDLRVPKESLRKTIQEVLNGRKLRSVSLIDVLEHIADPAALLETVRELLLESGAVFVISVPNIAHRDVGFKLAFGRYDIRATGILDHTHFHGFNENSFSGLLAQHGLHIIDRDDVLIEHSDQSYPKTHAALSGTTLLGSYLRELRGAVDKTATVNQLVAACLAGPMNTPYYVLNEQEIERKRPFLSIVTRTQGRRPATLRDVLLALSAQSCDDFELIVVGHKLDVATQKLVERLIEDVPDQLRGRIQLVRVYHGNRTAPLNAGFDAAKGDYVAILDDDDLPMAHWVETFKDLAQKAPGCMLRSVAVKQECDEVSPTFGSTAAPRTIGGFIKEYPSCFDWFEHLRVNQTPPIALAFPRSAFEDLKIRFDESLTTTEDWDFLMRVASVCGVASSPAVTCVYRWWKGAESSRSVHSQQEWQANHHRIFSKLDHSPTLLPAGATRQLRALMDRNDLLSHTLLELNAKLEKTGNEVVLPELHPVDASGRLELLDLLQSRSWKITAPIRGLVRIAKRLPKHTFDVASMSNAQVTQSIRDIRESSSWRVTASLRKISDRFK